MTDCTFCGIVRGDVAAHVLYQNDHALAILDIKPIHFGHILVIPKCHAETFVDLSESQLPGLIQATHVMSKALIGALNPEGYNIFSNNGIAAGQSVYHFHFHITPRYRDDNIRFILKLKEYSGDDMSVYAERIRRGIPRSILT